MGQSQSEWQNNYAYGMKNRNELFSKSKKKGGCQGLKGSYELKNCIDDHTFQHWPGTYEYNHVNSERKPQWKNNYNKQKKLAQCYLDRNPDVKDHCNKEENPWDQPEIKKFGLCAEYHWMAYGRNEAPTNPKRNWYC